MIHNFKSFKIWKIELKVIFTDKINQSNAYCMWFEMVKWDFKVLK